jgi:hypothetical protein
VFNNYKLNIYAQIDERLSFREGLGRKIEKKWLGIKNSRSLQVQVYFMQM